jgi:dTDP-4-amino-4,6-dideoxygalactose transaminase
MAGRISKYEWMDLGSSYVPSEVSCAILWAQLEKCELITHMRLTNFTRYHSAFSHMQIIKDRKVRLPTIPPECRHNGHIFYLIFPTAAMRGYVEARMKACGITCFAHYLPLHSSVAGRQFGKVGEGSSMRETDSAYKGLLRLPEWAGLTEENLESVINAVELVLTEYEYSERHQTCDTVKALDENLGCVDAENALVGLHVQELAKNDFEKSQPPSKKICIAVDQRGI